jgi:formylglycine-generating enzyme required for sulfatase activity
VRSLHGEDANPGVHSAAEWLLRQWGIAHKLPPMPPAEGRDWFIDKSGQTMIVVRGPVTFTMGSPARETSRSDREVQHEVRIPYSFAIGATEVTLREYERFLTPRHDTTIGPDLDCPVNNLNFNEVAAYCNWLSSQEGMAEHEFCFPAVDVAEGTSVIPYDDFLTRPGYRPPTEAEWEYLCRAGNVAARFTGTSPLMLEEYAWFDANSNQRSWPVGTLKPNDLGLFDIYGNLSEIAFPDAERMVGSERFQVAILRGGSFGDAFQRIRSAAFQLVFTQQQEFNRGLRLTRTLPAK